MDAAYWASLAADYQAAWTRVFGRPCNYRALCLAMSVAEHETNNSRAWPGTNNFGAVQLRSLTADEMDEFRAGKLKAGEIFQSTNGAPGGVLHIDTHPTASGPEPYPVWFVYFGND